MKKHPKILIMLIKLTLSTLSNLSRKLKNREKAVMTSIRLHLERNYRVKVIHLLLVKIISLQDKYIQKLNPSNQSSNSGKANLQLLERAKYYKGKQVNSLQALILLKNY